MTWNASPARSSRSTRPTYLPPHLRNPTSSPYRFNAPPNRGRTGDVPVNVSGDNIPKPEMKFDDLETEEDILNVSAYDDVPVNVSGDNIPKPVDAFSEMGFTKELSDNIKRCKYVKPTPIQRYAIPAAMDGRDLMACAQTGSGKTAAFCFPIISRIFSETRSRVAAGARGFRYSRNIACPLALILSPTRELSCQIHDEAKKFSYSTGLKVAVVYGGAPAIPQLRILEKGVDILVATPGRLVDMIEKSRVSLHEVKYLALDEADRMLDMGFEPQVRKIVQQMKMPPPGRRQTMLFSATFPTEIQKLASDFLSNYIFLAAGKVGSSTDLIVQKVEFVHDSDKRDHLRDLLQAQIPGVTDPKLALTLVFVETKKGADALEHWLIRSGFPSIAIHGDKVQMEREWALKSFRSGHTPILVATDVAARGLDIPHVAHVINFDLPRNIDDYVHRIGRTGRAGKSGVATAFFSDKNAPVAKDLVEVMQGANQEIPKWLSEYAETSLSGNGTRTTNRSGRTKFGGQDYRSAYSETGSGNAAASPCYDASGNPFSYGAPFAAPYYFPPQVESFPASPYGYNYAPTEVGSFPATAQNNYSFDYATVAATGWD